MKAILLSTLLLSGCCTMSMNRSALDTLMSEYDDAAYRENAVCLARENCDAVRTAHYKAAALLTQAADDGCKLAPAREAVSDYILAELP